MPMSHCTLCPRRCGVDRAGGQLGVCRMPADIYLARAALHPYEEPPVSGTRGSGTLFFAGCSLRCVFCQNKAVSRGPAGRVVTPAELADEMRALVRAGAHNINLVTATHYADAVADVLRAVRPELGVPVVWNTGGYETVETLRMLDGLVDVYLPDFKYVSPELSAACSGAADYAKYAAAALAEMYRQTGPVRFDENGLMTRGVLVRHLVLPGCRADSEAVLRRVAELVPAADIRLSLMRQYTPDFADENAPAFLRRRVTTFEYERLLELADTLGFTGYSQSRSAATAAYTPEF